MKKVADIMTRDIVSVSKNTELSHVMDLMEKNDVTKLPVMDEGDLVGIVTDNLIAETLGSIKSRGVPAERLHASSVMNKEFDSVNPEMSLEDLLEGVGKPGLTMVPVVSAGELVGILTKADLLPLVKSVSKLGDVMATDLFAVSPSDRVVHARRLLLDNDVARLPVLEDGKLVGFIADRDIAFALAELKRAHPVNHQNHRIKELLVGDVMRTNLITATPEMNVADAAKLMLEKAVGALPLSDPDGRIVGMVTRTDLLKTLSK